MYTSKDPLRCISKCTARIRTQEPTECWEGLDRTGDLISVLRRFHLQCMHVACHAFRGWGGAGARPRYEGFVVGALPGLVRQISERNYWAFWFTHQDTICKKQTTIFTTLTSLLRKYGSKNIFLLRCVGREKTTQKKGRKNIWETFAQQ